MYILNTKIFGHSCLSLSKSPDKGFDIDADRRNILSITGFRSYKNQIRVRQTENKRKHKYEKTSMPPSLGA